MIGLAQFNACSRPSGVLAGQLENVIFGGFVSGSVAGSRAWWGETDEHEHWRDSLSGPAAIAKHIAATLPRTYSSILQELIPGGLGALPIGWHAVRLLGTQYSAERSDRTAHITSALVANKFHDGPRPLEAT